MQRHELSREQAAWPQTLLVISGGCVGLLVSVVQKKLSIYHITLAGGILTCAGLVGASFATSIVWFTVTYGVIQGAGIGITLIGVAMYLLLYFDKYKATATAIKDIGMVAAAGVAGVPLDVASREGIRNGKETGPINSQQEDVERHLAIKGAKPLLNEEERCVPLQSEELPPPTNGAPSVFPVVIWIPFFVLVLLQVISEYGNSLFTTTIVDYATDKGAELGRA
ncbi:hypothetical protein MTO96_026859 [Rhipicephalus appendiculatus]